MNKLIITRWNGRILTALFSEKEVLELGLEETSSILGNIYIGKVNRIVKNLNSAFVEFGEGLTGYYSLDDNPMSLLAVSSWDSSPFAGCISSQKLKGGDEIIVQVAKEAIKTKDPVLTSDLNFAGKYVVLTTGKKTISFSSKIHDRTWKEEIRPKLAAEIGQETGIIVRTNGYGMDEFLLAEIRRLLDIYRKY